jgi:hypothetical protein
MGMTDLSVSVARSIDRFVLPLYLFNGSIFSKSVFGIHQKGSYVGSRLFLK